MRYREDACPCVWFFSATSTAYIHGLHREINIPDGDVLIHAGDFCSEGEAVEARSFGEFFRSLPHRHKVVIAGNHDRCLGADPGLGPEIFAGCHYLLAGGIEIEGVTYWGSPRRGVARGGYRERNAESRVWSTSWHMF